MQDEFHVQHNEGPSEPSTPAWLTVAIGVTAFVFGVLLTAFLIGRQGEPNVISSASGDGDSPVAVIDEEAEPDGPEVDDATADQSSTTEPPEEPEQTTTTTEVVDPPETTTEPPTTEPEVPESIPEEETPSTTVPEPEPPVEEPLPPVEEAAPIIDEPPLPAGDTVGSNFAVGSQSRFVSYDQGQFAGLGYTDFGLVAARSSDGVNWSAEALFGIPDEAELTSVARTNSGWVTAFVLPNYVSPAGEAELLLGQSSDLVNWTTTPLSLGEHAGNGYISVRGIAAVGDQIAVWVGIDGPAGDSLDVILAGHSDGAFEAVVPPVRSGWFDGLTSTNDRFLMLAFSDIDGAHVLESPDGFTWQRSSSLTDAWGTYDIVGVGNRVLVSGESSANQAAIWLSEDGGRTFEQVVLDSALSRVFTKGVVGPAGFAVMVSGQSGGEVYDDLGNPVGAYEVWFSADGRGWAPLASGVQTLAGAGTSSELVSIGDAEVILQTETLSGEWDWATTWTALPVG